MSRSKILLIISIKKFKKITKRSYFDTRIKKASNKSWKIVSELRGNKNVL